MLFLAFGDWLKLNFNFLSGNFILLIIIKRALISLKYFRPLWVKLLKKKKNYIKWSSFLLSFNREHWSHWKLNCSRHQNSWKIAELALNNNNSLTGNAMICIPDIVVKLSATYMVSYTSGYRYMIIFLLPSFTSSICNFYILILCTWSYMYVADSLTTISGMQIIAFNNPKIKCPFSANVYA
jgi:hypothetical protein